MITRTPESLLALGGLLADNPAPILGQIVANWSGYAQTYSTALQSAGTGLSNFLTTTLPMALQNLSNQLMSGDMYGASQTFSTALFNLAFGAGFPMLNVFSIPVDITQNLANTVAALGPSWAGVVATLGIGALFAVNGTSAAVGNSAQEVVDAITDGDPLGAFNALAAMPATVANALINGYYDPVSGSRFAGLLSIQGPPPPDAPPGSPWSSDGIFASLIKSRLTFANALGWEGPATTDVLKGLLSPTSDPPALASASTVPDAAAATAVTLSTTPAPIQLKVKVAPTTDVVAAPAGSATTEAASPGPAKEPTDPLVRKSLVATSDRTDALDTTTSNPVAKAASDVRDGISATAKTIGEGVKKAFSKPDKPAKAATTKSDAGTSGSAKHRAAAGTSGDSK
ncbi:hypothetical protein [Mycolicibacterium septicum]|uniref:hypothetical protein n=1 Tax=Mycolicibacterium septicum TaxID=98668 RepID=UPI001AF8AFF8|nr:hypothetical protein [Mycolicibacterium septicum]QRY53267.1 hypothetical protein JVX95_08070 [Mycolicibacterium septicum]